MSTPRTQPIKTATLLISCPDQKGIVASVSDFLFTNNANILHCDQHQDFEQSLFLMRVEWDLRQFAIAPEDFATAFFPLVQKFQMRWEIHYSQNQRRVAILVSKQDHCLTDLLQRHKAGELNCEISGIISNHADSSEIAAFYKIPFVFFSMNSDSEKKQAFKDQQALLAENKIDLVILARYMQILPASFVSSYPRKIINIHHSFLPAFVGAKPYHRAYERGVKLIGATSHYVTDVLDDGPIIEQDVMRVSHRDDVDDLIQKGRDLERIVLSRAVRWHLENRVLVYGNKTVIFD